MSNPNISISERNILSLRIPTAEIAMTAFERISGLGSSMRSLRTSNNLNIAMISVLHHIKTHKNWLFHNDKASKTPKNML